MSLFALDLEGLGFRSLLAYLQSPPYQEEPTIEFLTFCCSSGKEISGCRQLSHSRLVHCPLCFSVSYSSKFLNGLVDFIAVGPLHGSEKRCSCLSWCLSSVLSTEWNREELWKGLISQPPHKKRHPRLACRSPDLKLRRLDDGGLNLEVRLLKVSERYNPQLILGTLAITGLLEHTETEVNPQSAYPLTMAAQRFQGECACSVSDTQPGWPVVQAAQAPGAGAGAVVAGRCLCTPRRSSLCTAQDWSGLLA